MVDGRVGDTFAVAEAAPFPDGGRQITLVTSDLLGEHLAAYRASVDALGAVGIGRACQDRNKGKGFAWEDPRDLLDVMGRSRFQYYQGERRQQILATMTAFTLQLLEAKDV